MSRLKNKLTVIGIKNAGDGKYQDGGGLILVKKNGGGKWIYRYSFAGRRREMGLGRLSDVSLAAARRARDKWAAGILEGQDPITARQKEIATAKDEMNRNNPTFEEMAQIVFEARRSSLRGDGARGRWMSPIALHVIPTLGRKRMIAIHQTDIRDALRMIWTTKPATADKAFNRTRIIFQQARLMGLDVDPFVVDAARHMLGDLVREVKHIPATRWQDIPALYARLTKSSVPHTALRFMILTCARSTSVRGARFDEIEENVWTIPADRMKGRRGHVNEFRIPLSTEAQRVVSKCRAMSSSEFIFPGFRSGFVSDVAVAQALKALGERGRPHGFRTSFRTWVQDTGSASFDVAETALAHIVGSKVERTYARSDLLEPRRVLMERWAMFVRGDESSIVLLSGAGQ